MKNFDHSLIDLSSYLNSFADTAAIIEHLDLVISIDTAVAHLSGAMGKPTWTLLPFSADWRWLINRDDSPYYPTMKLFRQHVWGNWSKVFQNIKVAFNGLMLNEQTKVQSQAKNKGFSKVDLSNETLYLGLSKGENFGWGVCSKYLIRELSKKIDVININDIPHHNVSRLSGNFLQAIAGVNLNGINDSVRGDKNFGYTFFEDALTKTSIENAKNFDLILAGSTWCKERLLEAGITNCDTLLQGIDPDIFYPITKQKEDGLFVIFSGGKFELRKGQDIILKAFKILHEKYPDIILITSWFNIWPHTMHNMANSPHITYQHQGGSWEEIMNNIYVLNGIDPTRIKTLPLIPNEMQREIYEKTDIGIFPNRCEGGTNLVLMEYMACAKPVIASFCSGHTDIVNEDNSLMVKSNKELHIVDSNKTVVSKWYEPSLDELIASIEFAYHNRDIMKKKGRTAGEDMKSFTWEKSAARVLEVLYE